MVEHKITQNGYYHILFITKIYNIVLMYIHHSYIHLYIHLDERLLLTQHSKNSAYFTRCSSFSGNLETVLFVSDKTDFLRGNNKIHTR